MTTAGEVQALVTGLAGQEVRTLVEGVATDTPFTLEWQAAAENTNAFYLFLLINTANTFNSGS